MADKKTSIKIDQKFLDELEALEQEADGAFSMPAEKYQEKKLAKKKSEA